MNAKDKAMLNTMLLAWCDASKVSGHADPFHVPTGMLGWYVCQQCGVKLEWSHKDGHWLNDTYVIQEEPV